MTAQQGLKMKNKNDNYDIASSMSDLLNPDMIKKNAFDDSVNCAVENLNKAAEELENMGRYAVAEVITKLMESVPARELNKMASVWRVMGRHIDGEYEIADGVESLEAARRIIEEQTDSKLTWTSDRRAIDYYGGVLYAEERPDKLSPTAERAWEAVQTLWSAHEDEFWYYITEDNETTGEYLRDLFEGMSKENIAEAIDELIEKGFVKNKFFSSTYKRLVKDESLPGGWD